VLWLELAYIGTLFAVPEWIRSQHCFKH